MEVSITLPQQIDAADIRELLETDWLVPRKVRHFLRTRKNVRLNGEIAMFHQPIAPGDIVTLLFEDSDYPHPTIPLGDKDKVTVLWEDEHLIVLNKPEGMKTHPNQPLETDTLLNHLAAYLADHDQIPYVVHRLDKETSGAILFAKNPFVLPIIGRLLERKEIHRCYEAETSGRLALNAFTVNKKIGRHRHDRRKRVVDAIKGDTAITHISPFIQNKDTTWVECVLDTGRTHQIRVHLDSIGHPIMGDPLYHPTPSLRKRLQLHAKRLSFTHPFTKEDIHIEATPFLHK